MVSETPPPAGPSRRWLGLAMLVHLGLGGFYLVTLPLWGAVPDEPIHYSTIKYDAEFGRQPLITNPRPWGEPLAVYCFTADPVGAAAHGPLYYWSSVPVFLLTRGLTVEAQLHALRAWTLLVTVLMIPLAWGYLRRIFPEDGGLVVAGTLFVSLLPHRLMLSAVVYNDIACALGAFWYLLCLAKASGDGGTRRDWLIAGVALGVAFLGKRVALILLPGSLFAWWLHRRRTNQPWPEALRCLGLWAVGGAATAGWWVLRDVRLYGRLFPTEPGFEDNRVSWLTQYFAAPEVFFFKLKGTLGGLWVSFWSQDGWVPRDRLAGLVLYGLLGCGSLLAVVGYVGGYRSRWRGLSAEARDQLTVGVVMAAGMVYGAFHWVMQYSYHNHGETGKHAQTIAGCLTALSLAGWRWLLGPRRAVPAAWCGVALLIVFHVAALGHLRGELIPRWAPPTPALAARTVRSLPSGRAPGLWHRYRVPGVEQEGGLVPMPTGPGTGWPGG